MAAFTATTDASQVEKREPVFRTRESLFTTAIRDPVNQSTFGLFVSCQIIFLILTIVHYILVPSLAKQDIDILISTFSPIHVSLATEIFYLVLCSLLVIVVRMRMQSSTFWTRISYWLTVTLISVVIIVVPGYLIITNDPGVALTLSMLLHQVRILMKVISFVQENFRQQRMQASRDAGFGKSNNTTDTLSAIEMGDTKIVDQQPGLPTQKSMMYFLFAPTLIYQHSYPKSPEPTNWKMVFLYLIQWIFVFVPGVTVLRNMNPIWKTIGVQDLTPHSLMVLLFNTVAGATVFQLAIGYNLWHCWMNMFAEVMRFGDREFYGDWWTARNQRQTSNTFAGVIRTWLLRYVYGPSIRKGSRVLAIAAVNLTSAVIHDYIISMTFGFFYPLTTIFSVLGDIPSFVLKARKPKSRDKRREAEAGVNLLFLPQILFMASLAMFLQLEYTSRQNCPLASDASFTHFLVPRVAACVSFKL